MSRLLQLLNVLAVCLLSGVLAPMLVAQTQAGSRSPERFPRPDLEPWPETLQVYPAHAGDPVEVVRIMKDGNELVPGTYRMPQIAGDPGQAVDAVKGWLGAASFTLKSQSSKNIVSIGISVVFPTRRTDLECGESPGGEWCGANPHWCDGGCPELLGETLHWGLIPGSARSGLEARYRAVARGVYGDRVPLEGKEPLRMVPGKEITLSWDGRVAGGAHMDTRRRFADVVSLFLFNEGIEEATDTELCILRAYSNPNKGCAFAEVPKFSIALDIVYFEDGTIWGNYGYGYALPNPDGIFTRVDATHFPGIASPAPAPN